MAFNRGPEKPPITMLGTIEATTAKAFLFKAHEWDEAEWLPKSQVRRTDTDGDEVQMVIKAWLAEKNGWVDSGEFDPGPDVVDRMEDTQRPDNYPYDTIGMDENEAPPRTDDDEVPF